MANEHASAAIVVFATIAVLVAGGFGYFAYRMASISRLAPAARIGGAIFSGAASALYLDVAALVIFAPETSLADVIGSWHVTVLLIVQALSLWVCGLGLYSRRDTGESPD